jgi:hypothetical protein
MVNLETRGIPQRGAIKRLVRHSLGLAALILLAAGCKGYATQEGPSEPGFDADVNSTADVRDLDGGEDAQPGADATDPPEPTWDFTDCTVPQPGRTPLRRLTKTEYLNTVRFAFKDRVDYVFNKGLGRALNVPQGERVAGLDNNVLSQSISPQGALEYMLAAETIARYFTEYDSVWHERMPCLDGTDGEHDSAQPSCLREFVRSLGRDAFRRPLQEQSVDELVAIYSDVHATMGTLDPPMDDVDRARQATRAVIETIFQSSRFLYRVELGRIDDIAENGAVPIDDWEVASRLSYLMLRAPPDEQLRAAAEAGELRTPDQILTHVERFLETPEGREGAVNFIEQWLGIDVVDRIGKRRVKIDGNNVNIFGNGGRDSAQREADAFIDDLFASETNAGLDTLFTADWTYVDDTLAPFYGLEPIGTEGMRRVDLDPTRRSGILTQIGFLASRAHTKQVSSTQRGVFISRRILCAPPADPPPTIGVVPPEPSSDASLRVKMEQLTAGSPCASCHTTFDPQGFSLDHFDHAGRWRDTYYGHPVDPSGQLLIDGQSEPFDDAVGLMGLLADSEQVQDCAVEHSFAYAFGRLPDDADQCTILTLEELIAESDGDLRKLVFGLVTSDQFRYLQPKLASEDTQ